MAMSKEQILKGIERAEAALSRGTLTEGAKANLLKQVTQMKADLAALEKETEKKEEVIEKKEQAATDDLDAEIAKCEAVLRKNPKGAIKEVFEKKLQIAKQKKEDLAKEAKEDKAEAKQELKEVKEAVQEITKAVATGEKPAPIKKPKIEEKKRAENSKKRIAAIQSSIQTLKSLVDKNKELKDKYSGKNVDLGRDAGRSAKPFGYRFVGKHDYRVPTEDQIKKGLKRGTIDYEGRPNRSDKYPAGYKGNIREKLADGGVAGKKKRERMQVDLLKEDDYVWNAVGKKLVVDKVTDTEYYLSGFGTTGSSPWGKEKVDGYIKKGEWSIKPPTTEKKKRERITWDTEEDKMTGESEGERKAGMDEFAKGGKAGVKTYKLVPMVSTGVGTLITPDYKATINFTGTQDEAFDKARELVDSDPKFVQVETKIVSKTKSVTVGVTEKKEKMADGALVGDQSKLDKNGNGKLDKEDFEIIRGEKKVKKKESKKEKGGKLRKNSPHRFCWTKEAVKDKIIKPEQLKDTPSKYQRKKYPAYIMEK